MLVECAGRRYAASIEEEYVEDSLGRVALEQPGEFSQLGRRGNCNAVSRNWRAAQFLGVSPLRNGNAERHKRGRGTC